MSSPYYAIYSCNYYLVDFAACSDNSALYYIDSTDNFVLAYSYIFGDFVNYHTDFYVDFVR